MDYLFENLGDDRFQEFCQCLLGKEFPNVASFPIGQPDGGRDAVAFTFESSKKEFYVFQVKFVRNPMKVEDPHKWLIEIMEKEIDKISKLIPKGAKRYYLVTNVPGTAHLDVGSIDKLSEILKEQIPIPSQCFWRNDLARMIEKDPIFKWSFPEILNGQDVLNSVLFAGITEHRDRRDNVIRSYITDQYERDKEVKFKQIDLQNRLLKLYTDVPIIVKKFNEKDSKLERNLRNIGNVYRRYRSHYWREDEGNSIGAASFLLDATVQTEIQRVLVEGGPGQGKSTISQYVSQVHRVRLLNKSEDIDCLPTNIRTSPIRLPFKVDLRDLAAWVEKRNPYQEIFPNEFFEGARKNSLEAFLIYHIHYHSQQEGFTTNDFLLVCKTTPILLVFDGFDEIANLAARKEVIDFINKGLARLSANACSIQVIITSRPAAFSDSIGFSIEHFPHFMLADINEKIIHDYVEKWIQSSNLTSRDGNELRKLVKEKLALPHLKDLAKSPMQLAIFISLLRTKGESLPNKRTALYDSYVDLFFNRESEKNTLVRDKRDLIIEIHQYLAWILHSEAESNNSNGSIHFDDLRRRLKLYLEKEGHETEIADQLFDVMAERVCALVSRVQGTFEFEVQPLREYFCAKYLYDTSPHSPAGDEKKGTKPDRFHAISRNFYWNNVVRFFAGCLGKGELPLLLIEIKSLQNDELFKNTNYPIVLTGQLLSDYVFAQSPTLMKEVIQIITTAITADKVIGQVSTYGSYFGIQLPVECGGKEIVDESFKRLSAFPKYDTCAELIGILTNNPYRLDEKWLEHSRQFEGEALTQWFDIGYRLGILNRISWDDLKVFLDRQEQNTYLSRIQILANSGLYSELIKDENCMRSLLNGILSANTLLRNNLPDNSPINYLYMLTNPYILSYIFDSDEENSSFNDYLKRFQKTGSNFDINTSPNFSNSTIDDSIADFYHSVKDLCNSDLDSFRANLEPWETIVENGRRVFGNDLLFYLIAVIAAGVSSKDRVTDPTISLKDDSISLCKRVRNARFKSGNVTFWRELFIDHLISFENIILLLTWGTSNTILQLSDEISKYISDLDKASYLTLYRCVSITSRNSKFTAQQMNQISNYVNQRALSERFVGILSLRFKTKNIDEFINAHVETPSENLPPIINSKFRFVFSKFSKAPQSTKNLHAVRAMYLKYGTILDRNVLLNVNSFSINIPKNRAKEIMETSNLYPTLIVSEAERSCRIVAVNSTKPIGNIAAGEKWFS